jgi:hypothetical protein
MVAAAGPISLAEEYLKTQLANVAAFQTFVSAANAAAALLSIYNDALPAPAAANGVYTKAELVALHPYAVVETDPEGGYEMTFAAMGSGGHEYLDSGRIILRMVRIVPADTSIQDAERGWKNTVGQIMDGLFDLAGGAGYLAITGIALVGLHRFHPDDEVDMGDAQGATIAVDWGSEG